MRTLLNVSSIRLLAYVSAVWVASELILSFVRHSKSSESRDRFSFHLIWICITASIVAGSILRSVRPARIGGGATTFFIGIALIVAGLVVRWAAILTLRRYFTVDVAIRGDHRVIQHGIYRFVRHPAYLGSFVSFIGLGLAFGNWLSVIVIVVGTAIAFLYRISVEERALVAALGDEYRAYAARTKRFIPGVF
jgi:protein-S-isoprenylcysteine O-methyltransferase Ste14